jgi:GR25 family glycosyltransferase involved in LPS biosynthesis
MAYDMDCQNVLVLEDDFIFIDDVQKIHADIKSFFDSGIEWDVLMLTTCAAVVSENTSNLISRVSSSGNGAGYIVNRSMMLELSTLFKSNVENLYTTKQHWVYQNDILWKTIMPESKWYMFNHYLGYQQEGYSDLSQDQKIAIVPQIIESDEKHIEMTIEEISSEQTNPTEDDTSTKGETQTEPTMFTSDTIVNSVISSFISRSNIGLKKYGKTLDRDDLSVFEWIQHAQEEHMDAILYLEKLKSEIKTNEYKK